jgi:hypothetical protein
MEFLKVVLQIPGAGEFENHVLLAHCICNVPLKAVSEA